MFKKAMAFYLIALLCAAQGWGQSQGTASQDPKQKDARQQADQQRRIQGQIVKEKEVKIRNTDRRNKVVLLKTQGDQKIAVDLGPVDKLKEVQVKKDQQITVQGKSVRIGDRPVFFADKLTVGDKTVQIERPEPKQQKQKQRQKDAGTAERHIKGQILRDKEVGIKDSQTRHKVVLIKSQKGQQVAVDLGSVENLKDLQLKTGKSVEVTGHPVRVGDRLVILADKLTVDGKTVNIKHPAFQSGQKKSP